MATFPTNRRSSTAWSNRRQTRRWCGYMRLATPRPAAPTWWQGRVLQSGLGRRSDSSTDDRGGRARRNSFAPGGVIVEPTSGTLPASASPWLPNSEATRASSSAPDQGQHSTRSRRCVRYGAEVVVCPTAVPPEDPRSYHQVSDRLATETPGAWKPDQYANPNNRVPLRGHRAGTLGTDRRADHTHFVAGVGTGGTISGWGVSQGDQ